MLPFTFNLAFSFDLLLKEPIPIGLTADGYRMMITWEAAEAQGPMLQAELQPLGGDWVLVRQDGMLEIDVRAMLKAADGTWFNLNYSGLGLVGPEEVQKFLATGRLPQKVVPLRSGGGVRTALFAPDGKPAPRAFLNGLYLMGIGAADLTNPTRLQVHYDFYAMTWPDES